jgi:ribulose-5-phosphate 4-epimerase/fuculose-1-phosphate aldolase
VNEAALRREICRVGGSLFERGYAHSTAGNISVRLPGDAGFLITPTDASTPPMLTRNVCCTRIPPTWWR